MTEVEGEIIAPKVVRERWLETIISALGSLRQEDLELKTTLAALPIKFQAKLGYLERPCLNTPPTHTQLKKKGEGRKEEKLMMFIPRLYVGVLTFNHWILFPYHFLNS